MECPWPSYAYIPGQTPRHDPMLFDELKKQAGAWDFGLQLLKAGFYWECHEVVEAVWLRASPNSEEQRVAQGVIQLANAALKWRMGRGKAAQRIAAIAADLFASVGSEKVLGISPLVASNIAKELGNGPVQVISLQD
ncbi:MAG: DUF309 domain-containing protein [Rhodospirillales bacterium]|jgi:hypothetical protein